MKRFVEGEDRTQSTLASRRKRFGACFTRTGSRRSSRIEPLIQFAAKQDRLSDHGRIDPRINPNGTPADWLRYSPSKHVSLARLKQRHLVPEWAAHVALSFVGRTYLETEGYGGTKIQLSLDDVANLVMTVPEIERTINHHYETAKLDALTAEAQRVIELLKERRTALISAAVTGKIDVRGLAA